MTAASRGGSDARMRVSLLIWALSILSTCYSLIGAGVHPGIFDMYQRKLHHNLSVKKKGMITSNKS